MSRGERPVAAREVDRRFLSEGFAKTDGAGPEVLEAYDAEFAAWDAAELGHRPAT